MKLFGIDLIKAIRKVRTPKVTSQLNLFDQPVTLFGGETKQFGENDTRRFDKEKGRWVDADNENIDQPEKSYPEFERTNDDLERLTKVVNGKRYTQNLSESQYEFEKRINEIINKPESKQEKATDNKLKNEMIELAKDEDAGGLFELYERNEKEFIKIADEYVGDFRDLLHFGSDINNYDDAEDWEENSEEADPSEREVRAFQKLAESINEKETKSNEVNETNKKEIEKPKNVGEGLRNFYQMIINRLEEGDINEAGFNVVDLIDTLSGKANPYYFVTQQQKDDTDRLESLIADNKVKDAIKLAVTLRDTSVPTFIKYLQWLNEDDTPSLPKKPVSIKTHSDLVQYAKSINLDLSLISEQEAEDLETRIKKEYKRNQLSDYMKVDKMIQQSIYRDAKDKNPEELSLYAYATREFLKDAKMESSVISSALWVSPKSYRDTHKKAVEKALQEGKDVPIKVLHEYSDLRSKYKGISLPPVEGLSDGFSTNKESADYIPSSDFARSLHMNDNGRGGMYELKEKVPIEDIKIDKNRFSNANPIYEGTVQTIIDNFDVDQFNPITIDREGYLRDGQHRLEVAKRKGLKYIDAVIDNTADSQIDLSWLENEDDSNKRIEYAKRDFRNIDNNKLLSDEKKKELKAEIWNGVRSYTGGSNKTLWQLALSKNYPVVKSGYEKSIEFGAKEFEAMLREIKIDTMSSLSESDKMIKKLEQAIKLQETMKNVNAIIRNKDLSTPDKLSEIEKLGIDKAKGLELLKPDFAGRVGFPDYALRNNSANIRRMEMRVGEIRNKESQKGVSELKGGKLKDGSNVQLVRNSEIDRIQLIFDGIPDASIRNRLKSRGWKWSPKNKAWQRMNTENSIRDAEQFLKEFNVGD
jgi:hypothetical protein